MSYVLTLTGPSRCGKSMVIDLLYKIHKNGEYKNFYPIIMPKFTTREFRKNEIDLIKTKNIEKLDVRPVIGEYNKCDCNDNIEEQEKRMEAFKKKRCDLAYEQYGNRYGLRLADLYEYMGKGQTPIVILNDVRTVEDIKTALGRQCCSIFIFREIPDINRYREQGALRNESESEIIARFEKAEAIYRIYIENIHIFDKLLLNIHNGDKEVENMLNQLVARLCVPSPEFS